MLEDITPYRVVVPLISFIVVCYAWNHVVRGTKTIWEGILWTLFWGAIAFVVLFPRWISFLTTWTGIKDQENAIFAIAIGVLLFIVFHLVLMLEKTNRRIAELTRKVALKDIEKKE